jgi:hypothetical protein
MPRHLSVEQRQLALRIRPGEVLAGTYLSTD